MHFRSRKIVRTAFLALLLIGLMVGIAAFANGPIQESDANILVSLTGEGVGDAFGWVGENLGDISGDSINDFILSAPFHSAPGTTASGKIYVYSGSDGALLNAFAGDSFDQLGYSASSAGDVNNDGVPDYIAGGTGASTAPDIFRGRVVVFSGADHTILYDLPGPTGDRYGASVAGAGDLNGDDHDDFLVGAPRTAFIGKVYAYSGLDGALLWTVDGFGPGFSLGTAAGKVGDLTGDSVPEVVFGAAGAPGAGDGSATGGGRAYVLNGLDGAVVHTLKPTGTAGVFGLFFASGAGDVNADGVPDIYVGDFADRQGAGSPANPNSFITGRAYIFSGADGSRIRVINAENTGDGMGPGRGIGQDVNGDGYGDIFAAGYTNSDVAPFAGKAYVISGKNGNILRTFTGTIAGDWLGAEAFPVGDVNGDGLVDYVLTAYGLAFAGVNGGSAYLVAGTP